jgi:hypothetical protein
MVPKSVKAKKLVFGAALRFSSFFLHGAPAISIIYAYSDLN